MPAVLRDYANPIHRRPHPVSVWRGFVFSALLGFVLWDLLLLWFLAIG